MLLNAILTAAGVKFPGDVCAIEVFAIVLYLLLVQVTNCADH